MVNPDWLNIFDTVCPQKSNPTFTKCQKMYVFLLQNFLKQLSRVCHKIFLRPPCILKLCFPQRLLPKNDAYV